ncbi:MAG: hypothetical protein EXR58_04670 [Chloroflexi bacterium]|nr:hypothetical protein [Chloroflexota bacterium]
MAFSDLTKHLEKAMTTAATDRKGASFKTEPDDDGAPVAKLELRSGRPPRILQVQHPEGALRWQVARGYVLGSEMSYQFTGMWMEEVNLAGAAEDRLTKAAERVDALVATFLDDSQYPAGMGNFRLGA